MIVPAGPFLLPSSPSGLSCVKLGNQGTWAWVRPEQLSPCEIPDLSLPASKMGSCEHIAQTPCSGIAPGFPPTWTFPNFSLTTPPPTPALLSAEKPSCEGVQCPPSQICQVVDGHAKCMPGSVAVCRAQGDPHYTTFDGRRYDMMGTCTYTMVELNSEDQTLPAFSVEAKNEHRGSRRVSYVGFVSVQAYSHSVSLARGEVGFAQVRNLQGYNAHQLEGGAKPGCRAP